MASYDAKIIYAYIVEGKGQERIARETGLSQAEVSELVKGYNAGVNPAWAKEGGNGSGPARGVFKPGKSRAHGIRVTADIIDEYLDEGGDGYDFENFLRNYRPYDDEEEEVYTPPRPQATHYQGYTSTPKAPQKTFGGDLSNYQVEAPGEKRVTYVSTGPYIPWSKLLIVVGFIGFLAFGMGNVFKQAFPGVSLKSMSAYFSDEYEAEVFTYEGREYLGNQRFGKPDGVCMQYYNDEVFTLGEYDSGTLNGYAIVREGEDYGTVGYFKKGELDGIAVRRADSCFYVGSSKKGSFSGYGYAYDFATGTEQLVKYDAKKNYTDCKVIAVRAEDGWYKPNGKPFKVKDETYKKITRRWEGCVAIGDTEVYLDGANGGQLGYSNPNVLLGWDGVSYSYSTLEDGTPDEGILYTYDAESGSLYAQVKRIKGSQVETTTFGGSIG